jgi:hypothetical protein
MMMTVLILNFILKRILFIHVYTIYNHGYIYKTKYRIWQDWILMENHGYSKF